MSLRQKQESEGDGMPCYTKQIELGCYDVDDVKTFEFRVSGEFSGLCENYNNYELIWVD